MDLATLSEQAYFWPIMISAGLMGLSCLIFHVGLVAIVWGAGLWAFISVAISAVVMPISLITTIVFSIMKYAN